MRKPGSKQDRQEEFLRIVEETGSQVQARRRLGLTTRAVAEWRRDPDFVERLQEAHDVASDAIRARVRELALEGDTAMLSLSMKVIEPVLRSAVQVGVQVNGSDPRIARLEKMTDEQLCEQMRTWVYEMDMHRAARQRHQIDAEVVSAPLPLRPEDVL